jgi:hypothetical protein
MYQAVCQKLVLLPMDFSGWLCLATAFCHLVLSWQSPGKRNLMGLLCLGEGRG